LGEINFVQRKFNFNTQTPESEDEMITFWFRYPLLQRRNGRSRTSPPLLVHAIEICPAGPLKLMKLSLDQVIILQILLMEELRLRFF